MSKEETYDIVIIGADHNGTTVTAYLAKGGVNAPARGVGFIE